MIVRRPKQLRHCARLTVASPAFRRSVRALELAGGGLILLPLVLAIAGVFPVGTACDSPVWAIGVLTGVVALAAGHFFAEFGRVFARYFSAHRTAMRTASARSHSGATR